MFELCFPLVSKLIAAVFYLVGFGFGMMVATYLIMSNPRGFIGIDEDEWRMIAAWMSDEVTE